VIRFTLSELVRLEADSRRKAEDARNAAHALEGLGHLTERDKMLVRFYERQWHFYEAKLAEARRSPDYGR